ncbi:DUF3320 domain-containing protein [Silvimonas sp.]|uniref:DUF3320 domain-containing protein n=1 Tax=Silvimonas sp. TaxID=2650811 RepID=UPI002849282E|nr:DUF3320 domain-containing protein [Silvimonas sp.]MDR3425829.1 DUF3320 domain-containing protein [Silvimonas sp.]
MKLFDDTRRRLVETGTRNRLVHVNRANTRGNVLNIQNERSNDVYDILSRGKIMRFLATGSDRAEDRGQFALPDATVQYDDDGHYTDDQLETRLGPDALQKKLLKIAREAQTAEEESGVNMLYLAMGFLTWFEDKVSNVPREAPLVLLPVELKRNARTSTYDIRARDEDALTNLPLQQRLRDDFGIDLPELEIGEDWRPSDYFAQVADVTAARNRWKIDPDAIQLGFFSFNKLLMYRDLAIDAWPDDALADHALTRGLLYEGFEREEPLFGSDDRLDDVLPPDKLFHVVDADASQAKVIEEVRAARNLVVQGPPGTGKSQTITNIIAAAVTEGKRVLFLAEKMAALSVVHDRLVKVGLRDVCLELHSKGANKKSVLGELARTLNQASAKPQPPGPPEALKQSRDRLNDLAAALHRPIGNTGETAFSVLGRQSHFIGNGYPAPRLNTEILSSMTREAEANLVAALEEYGTVIESEGGAVPHPYEGTRNLDIQPVDLARLAAMLSTARSALLALAKTMREPLEGLSLTETPTFDASGHITNVLERLEGLPADGSDIAQAILSAPDIAHLLEALQAGASWREAHDEAAALFIDAAFMSSAVHLRGPLSAGANSFFARWGSRYRDASRELAGLLRERLPKTAAERVEQVDRLGHVAALKSSWESDEAYCSRVLGDAWRGPKTDFARLIAIGTWCLRLTGAPMELDWGMAISLAKRPDAIATMRKALREIEPVARASMNEVANLLDLDPATFGVEALEAVDLNIMATRFGTLAGATSRYSSWARRARLQKALVSAGLSELEARMRLGDLTGTVAAVELRFARAECLWKLALAQNPDLRGLEHERRHDLVATFTALERQKLKDNVTSILAGHLGQVPQGAMGEMRVIRGEIGKKRGHIALRRLFERAGTAIQRIKPVLLMSPISVAQFLPAGTISFDLLVIDEASQVRPEDAIGAIARASQIVVVGDKKQLPPSSFFDRLLADDEDENEGDDEDAGPNLLGGAATIASMESILTLCEARGLPGRMLKWHYRSRDPSLIEVSNHEFYESDLVLPPSPLQKDPAYGLCFTRVDGVYDKGGKRDNRKEGEAIVDRVAAHARANPSQSLGIVTFSFAQRNLITELLESRRRRDTTLDEFLREGQAEDPFVKNIENVQGDERDVILISVGYGPAIQGGRLSSMSFGPVNGEGGERRLNVLFTRARIRCEIFASFDPGDIDLSRTKAEGPRILKRFLEFAKNGRLDESSPTGANADSPFEEDVANVIRGAGFLADPQVGSAGFRIDLGVRHPDKPGTYILAIECDGATYHSALWARERDRLRQEVLEHLGWHFHRVWSTDWFYNRSAEIERLRTALFAAHARAAQGLKIDGANKPRTGAPNRPADGPPTIIEVPEAVERQMPPYRRAVFPVRSSVEPHEASVSVLADLVRKIVEAEGPIHVEEVSRRVAACFNKEKAGSRILAATRTALARAQSGNKDLLSNGSFWFTRAQADEPPVRDRSAEAGATLKADNISQLEIEAAFKIAREDNAGCDDADLIRTAARLLGFKRVGQELQARISTCL